MKNKQYSVNKLIRKGRLPGPWDNEPDELKWTHKGMLCYIKRNKEIGNLCGYVQIQKDHPLSFKDRSNDDVGSLAVHGGITFCGTIDKEKHWWIGFDTAHGGDSYPSPFGLSPPGTYRDIKYVIAETEKLADQLL